MTCTVGELLARRARLQGERPALVTPAGTRSYRALDEYVDRIAAALLACGIAPGDRVAVVDRNGEGYLALYYAIARIGAVIVGVNWRLSTPEVAHILADSSPRLVLCGTDFEAMVAPAAAGIAIPAMSTGEGSTALERFDTRIEAGARPAPIVVSPDAPLAICYTSGTTGRPKGAVLAHAQLVGAAETIASTVDYRLHDVSLIATPLFHVGGLSFATLFSARGASAVVPPAWVPADILATIARHRVNHFFAVPAMLESLLGAMDATSDCSSLRWIMTGAAPLPSRLIGQYHERGIALLQSYGATETAGPGTCVDVDNVLAKQGSIGKPFFHTEVRLMMPGGTGAAPYERGELQVRGSHVFAGYWNNPDASREALVDGWFVTGDVGYADSDGYFYLVDRKKEVIISGGENVYPAEVELVLSDHPAIVEVGVVGVPDARWGEAVCAVVVVREGATLELDALREYCRVRLASYKLPKRLVQSPAPLARNATGKIVKQSLRALAGLLLESDP